MRPEQLQDYALDLAKNTPGVTRVQTLAEAGDTKHPYGLAVSRGKEERWQFIGQLAPGEKFDAPAAPVEGAPASGPAPAGDAGAEEWLAGILLAAENPQIASVTRWSTREGERPGNYGLTVDYHNGARTFIRAL
ncbi:MULTISPECIES: hypothetical protein [Streptomyces]|uniref:Uncharacterized protein n=1 Tax=Streptomyces evansiae TaxID=3075535 RepID=A0ABU2R2N3_9ACTN|nr:MULTISPECIES: hypothetical protein [unclassified Streptomyces]MDT0409970.1 hypothetical protein [Streptomyces sp. DSM 41979]MYQ59944.1 hypothetical protein [Streptomyces sp. SID4926]SCD37065.1 hypothetical protein GA0115251_105923 [Streptomyces sp. TverLS-915]SCE54232.1 hypothetical protein GA0115252_160522 [Streptomyces sp. DfronAA-171]